MIYSKEVENMCTVAKGPKHGPAPIPEEGKWVKIGDYHDADAAAQELKEGVERFKQQL